MVGKLLLRGMLVGVLAGVLCFGFLKLFGEPHVDRAIAFEAARLGNSADATDPAKAASMPGMSMPAESVAPDLFSRDVQSGLGLLVGVTLYSAAFGGLFALAFVLLLGRLGSLGVRGTAAATAAAGFVAVYLVPSLKYPASPPSVGDADTIDLRTALYFAAIVLSLAASIGAGLLHGRLLPRVGAWNAAVIAAAVYIAAMVLVGLLLPVVNEVPQDFPAVVLWQFRLASIGAQALMWATIGLGFGILAEPMTSGRAAMRLKPA